MDTSPLWTPEMADSLAKKGTTILQKPTSILSFHSAKLIINKIIKTQTQEKLKSDSTSKPWSILFDKSSVPEGPRQEAVAIFRLITGHDCLAAHLHKISIFNSPKCVLCNEEDSVMDKNHLQMCSSLKTIPDLDNLSKLYWEARKRMESIQVLGH